MTLDMQIKTFLISLLFGFIFFLFIDIIKKRIFKIKKIWQILFVMIYVIFFSISYFLILLNLNNAIIHPYYLFAFIFSYILEIIFIKILKRIVLLLKK